MLISLALHLILQGESGQCIGWLHPKVEDEPALFVAGDAITAFSPL